MCKHHGSRSHASPVSWPRATKLKLWYEAVTTQVPVAKVQHTEDASPHLIQGLKVVRNESDLSEQDNGGVEERGQGMKFRDMEMTLVVVDGNWEHAQEMLKASLPFLSNFITQVCLLYDVRSEGYSVGELDLITRKEPFGGCVSIMEAVAQALAFLEPDGYIVASKLIDVLRKMVALQASYFSSPKVRPKLKKNSKECSQLPLG